MIKVACRAHPLNHSLILRDASNPHESISNCGGWRVGKASKWTMTCIAFSLVSCYLELSFDLPILHIVDLAEVHDR